MNTRLVVLLALASASLSAVLVSACGGDTATTDGGSDATTNGDTSNTNDTGTPNDTGTNDTGTNNDTGSGSGPCADAGFGCRQCCVGLYPDAAATLLANEETCACTTPGDCKAACNNNLCQGKAPGGQCSACLRNADAGNCTVTSIASCESDPQCKPLADCEIGCPAPGPTLDGGGPG